MELLVTILLALIFLSAADAHLWPQPASPKRGVTRRPARSATSRRRLTRRPACRRNPSPAKRPAPGWAARALAHCLGPRNRPNPGPLWWWE